MSYRSEASSSDDDVSSSSEDDQSLRCTRKFEISRKIEKRFQMDKQNVGKLASQWSFLLDDGMFERQANFSSTADLWRHLDKIDTTMTKIRERCKKGSVRLFKAEYASLLAAAAPGGTKRGWENSELLEHGGKWVVRFSRKFPVDLSDTWVELVLGCVAEALPCSDMIMGCVLNTRKGKTEMEVWTSKDPMMPSQNKKDVQVLSEHEQQLAMRELLEVGAEERTIQIQYKSHTSKRQKKLDYERVMHVQQKKSKGGTWPLLASAQTQQAQVEDEKEKLAEYKEQIDADPYAYQTSAAAPAMYQYDYSHEADSYEAEPQDTCAAPFQYDYSYAAEPLAEPEAALQPEAVAAPVVAPVPVALEELQQQQLADLRLQPSTDSEAEEAGAVDLASLRTRLDSLDRIGRASLPGTPETLPETPSLACLRSRLESDDLLEASAPVAEKFPEPKPFVRRFDPFLNAKPHPMPALIDPEWEKRQLYCGDNEADDEGDDDPEDPLAFLDAMPVPIVGAPKACTSLLAGSPPTLVLGTNPPDFSSPVMKATLRMHRKQLKYISW